MKIEQCMDCPILDWNKKDCLECHKFDFGADDIPPKKKKKR